MASRRKFVHQAGAATARLVLAAGSADAAESPGYVDKLTDTDGKYAAAPLPFAYDALEPHIDARTVELHYTFHHKPAVAAANKVEEALAKARESNLVELSHVGELCSFDAFLKKYNLTTPPLRQLAAIVRGADTSRLDLTPQSAGLYAILLGLSQAFPDDHEMLRHGMVMYDALYARCESCQGEMHNWPPQM
ncbi:chromate resistance protein ChrB domain-containing protein [Cupriavidus sp. TMH.W2]|uniref:chromate resistance protein ChrB domain-containing protein n=1 Tax=Cupriavidus sp. TMH.W2 TaxID=3434465 RepID=UPI003D76B83B